MAFVRSRPRKTVEDYLALPDEVLAELIDGELYVNPAPTPNHQDVIGALHVLLRPFVESQGLGRVFLSPVDVYLPTGDIVQPDLVFVRRDQLAMVEDAIRGVPALAIEVLSPSRPERDRLVKKRLFATNGIGEYWIVDPSAGSVEVFVLAGAAYEPTGWFVGTASVVSPTLPGLEIPVAKVFRTDESR